MLCCVVLCGDGVRVRVMGIMSNGRLVHCWCVACPPHHLMTDEEEKQNKQKKRVRVPYQSKNAQA